MTKPSSDKDNRSTQPQEVLVGEYYAAGEPLDQSAIGRYVSRFSNSRFWRKLSATFLKAGEVTVETALVLYYTLVAEGTPLWCRTVILGALGYFISMVDAIPDLTPVLGYTDDLSVMVAAVATIATHITPEIRERAKVTRQQIFGSFALPEESK